VHGHTALFGICGMLGLVLTLLCLRALKAGRKWKQGPLLSFRQPAESVKFNCVAFITHISSKTLHGIELTKNDILLRSPCVLR
jgi:nitric oxide reductase large subunit